ncbi:MAG: leucine-rich repeat domain-containing protein [Bacteroidales bacterium]|nr:leucine-rich repeat domain-containing protein [Bacteroidales bacterium]
MKTTKKFMMVCCLIILAATSYGQIEPWIYYSPWTGYDFSTECETGQTLYYRIIDSVNYEVALTHPAPYSYVTLDFWEGFDKPTGDIVFPSEVTHEGQTYTVTVIDDGAFRQCSGMTGSLIIPNTVTFIGYYAFDCCYRFTGALEIPDGVTIIGRMAFNSMNEITSVSIPNSVVAIGEKAFASFWKITAFSIPESVTYLEPGFIWACSKLVTLEVDENNPVYYSESNAVIERETKKLVQATKTTVIPEDITVIGAMAFEAVENKGNLVIPQSVISIEDEAFKYAHFTGTLNLPENLQYIGKYAFYFSYCTGALYIPDGVSCIGEYTFTNSGFSEIHLPKSLKTIEGNTFYNCTRLEMVEIQSEVDSIGSGVFQHCDRLNCLKVHCEVPPECWYSAFSGVSRDIPVHIPVGTLADYQSAPYWNEFTNFIEDGLMSVDEQETSVAQVTCYPNPATTTITIDGLEASEVQIYNALGQLVKTVRNSNEIGVENMARGVYLLRISDVNGTTKTKRITVTK